jgi:hypothetical protein
VVSVTNPYSRLSRPKPLLFLPSSSSVVLMRLSGPGSRPTTFFFLVVPGTPGSVARNSDHLTTVVSGHAGVVVVYYDVEDGVVCVLIRVIDMWVLFPEFIYMVAFACVHKWAFSFYV